MVHCQSSLPGLCREAESLPAHCSKPIDQFRRRTSCSPGIRRMFSEVNHGRCTQKAVVLSRRRRGGVGQRRQGIHGSSPAMRTTFPQEIGRISGDRARLTREACPRPGRKARAVPGTRLGSFYQVSLLTPPPAVRRRSCVSPVRTAEFRTFPLDAARTSGKVNGDYHMSKYIDVNPAVKTENSTNP